VFSLLADRLTMIPSAKTGKFEGAVSEEEKMSVLLSNLGIRGYQLDTIYRVVLTLFWVSLSCPHVVEIHRLYRWRCTGTF
jgi:hypothetical protein